mmetsp:Transcript_19115/g.42245  ORF Transcript_19115/g.42245 Transcript_19115/m.42245 type:complete len:111 (+) Transcript_19115:2043-2375(+)
MNQNAEARNAMVETVEKAEKAEKAGEKPKQREQRLPKQGPKRERIRTRSFEKALPETGAESPSAPEVDGPFDASDFLRVKEFGILEIEYGASVTAKFESAAKTLSSVLSA